MLSGHFKLVRLGRDRDSCSLLDQQGWCWITAPNSLLKHLLLKIHNNSTFAELLFSVKVDFLIISAMSYK